jgi:type II secretory pathway predicted ATPase ExeA
MEWFARYGFGYNPLTSNAQETVDRGLFTGRDAELAQLQEFVDSGELVLVTGEPGIGKTTLLQQAHELNKAKYNSFLVMCSEHPEFDVLPSVKAKRSVLDFLFRRELPARESVFFLNEAKFLNEFTGEDLKTQAKDKRSVKSVVCACVDTTDLKVDAAFLDRVGDRVIRLDRLPLDGSVSLLKARLGKRSMFDAGAMLALHRLSKGNPRRLLEKAELACIKFAPKKVSAPMVRSLFR